MRNWRDNITEEEVDSFVLRGNIKFYGYGRWRKIISVAYSLSPLPGLSYAFLLCFSLFHQIFALNIHRSS